MKKFATYTVHEFIADPDFIDWVKNPSEEKQRYWVLIQEVYPRQRAVIQQAIAIVQELAKYSPEIDEEMLVVHKQRLMQVIADETNLRTSFFRQYRSQLIAAVVSGCLLGLTVLYFFHSTKQVKALYELSYSTVDTTPRILENTSDTLRAYILPDSSIIELYPQSKLSYNYHSYRAISLQGKALFTVKRDEQKPFVVYTNGVTTRVLGTQFIVDAYQQAATVKVAVKLGKVQVYPSDIAQENVNSNSIFLTPNQEASYEKEAKTLLKNVIQSAQILPEKSTHARDLKYIDTPLPDLFAELEELYGIRFVYDQAKFSNCRVNLSLSEESLFDVLELIGKVVDGHYNTLNGEVTFVGEGCN